MVTSAFPLASSGHPKTHGFSEKIFQTAAKVKTRRRLEAMRQRHEARRKTHQLEEWNRQRMAKEEQRQRICDRQRLRMEERERSLASKSERWNWYSCYWKWLNVPGFINHG